MPHLSVNGPSEVVFERLWDYFHLEDSVNGILQLFQLCFHIAHGRIPPQMTHPQLLERPKCESQIENSGKREGVGAHSLTCSTRGGGVEGA
jgi:hypothetical protein